MKSKTLKNKISKILTYLFVFWLLIVLWGFIFAWRKVPEYIPVENVDLPVSIMTSDGYAEVINIHPRPYIVLLENNDGGGVFVYGAEHTKNPNDSQIVDIQSQWANFKPSIALVESRLGIMFPGLMNPVETFSEPGAVHALARESGIPTYTWEPPIEVEMANLLRQPFLKNKLL